MPGLAHAEDVPAAGPAETQAPSGLGRCRRFTGVARGNHREHDRLAHVIRTTRTRRTDMYIGGGVLALIIIILLLIWLF